MIALKKKKIESKKKLLMNPNNYKIIISDLSRAKKADVTADSAGMRTEPSWVVGFPARSKKLSTLKSQIPSSR